MVTYKRAVLITIMIKEVVARLTERRDRILQRSSVQTLVQSLAIPTNIHSYCRGSGLENQEYSRRDPLCWPHNTLYPQKLALTSPTCSGRLVGIVRSRTEATEFLFVFVCIAEVFGANLGPVIAIHTNYSFILQRFSVQTSVQSLAISTNIHSYCTGFWCKPRFSHWLSLQIFIHIAEVFGANLGPVIGYLYKYSFKLQRFSVQTLVQSLVILTHVHRDLFQSKISCTRLWSLPSTSF
jgi:hypothetical protein